MLTRIQRTFAPLKRITPRWFWSPLRRAVTALAAPILFSAREGHFISSLMGKAVDGRGMPLPWYSYPAIDFLKARDFREKTVLEFGAGQSTRWWASRAKRIVAFDESHEWLDTLRPVVGGNVELHFVRMNDTRSCVDDVGAVLGESSRFDVIVIDGLDRGAMIPIALRCMAPDGFIICDNAEGYGVQEGFLGSGLARVDFYGMVPGVVLQHCTSIFFAPGCFAFDAKVPISSKYQP